MRSSVMTRLHRPLRIAIIEDEALIALEMEDHLTEAGHEVVGIADMLEGALALVEATGPDLALIDIQLADGSSGLDVAKALDARGIPCLFVTGNCPGPFRFEAIGCLHKPYGQSQLLDAVEAAIAVIEGEEPPRVPREMHLYRQDGVQI